MLLLRSYSTRASAPREHYASSSIKIYRKARAPKQKQIKSVPSSASTSSPNDYYENPVKIQMISQNLHKQIFPQAPRRSAPENTKAVQDYQAELHRHGIDIHSSTPIEDIQLKLPPLHGKNIEEHFYNISKEQVKPYEDLLWPLVKCTELPKKPKRWAFHSGWTAYDPLDGTPQAVDHPMEKGLIFDVEVCVKAGQTPVLATAVSTKRWYSWVSPKLTKHRTNSDPMEYMEPCDGDVDTDRPYHTPNELIPLGDGPGLIVGHNVSYDRARLKEQYLLEDSRTRFVDTMSLHMCVSGVTSYQRAMLKSKKEPAPEDLNWLEQSSLNSLVEVHRLYCGGEPLSKEPRNIFVEGTLEQVRQSFQSLVNYCAGDVEATYRVLSQLYPLYAERFPHPASLAGMLEMGSAYLPVNSNWERYIRESQLTYEDLSIEAKYHLGRRAEEACSLLHDEKYKEHIWLWDEDWSVQALKLKKAPKRKPLPKLDDQREEISSSPFQAKFQPLYDQRTLLPARRPLLPGYPQWYRKLCQKPPLKYSAEAEQAEEEWMPGATGISTGMQIAPKLLSLCWEGYPLHYLKEHGWGFLVPFRNDAQECRGIPLEQLLTRCPVPEFARHCASANESDFALDALPQDLNEHLGKREYFKKISKRQKKLETQYKGSGVWCNHILEDSCFFLKLPHKNGPSYRVGNPLSRDFLNKFSENVLSSGDPTCQAAARVIEIARTMSYWRNNRDRIMNQMVVWLQQKDLPSGLTTSSQYTSYGAICPQVVACGTLTRRAMEPTWMTASNSRPDRLGSELRSMVQAPPGYRLIGADVDSQELWIASVLGDAYAWGEHGATPLGWMTLSGNKSNQSDMHSITAKAVGISRDHAKVINYARIYGAGQQFAENLLQQFNPTFSASEAKAKAMKMFSITKGKRSYKLREEFHDELDDRPYSSYEATRLAVQRNRPVSEVFHRSRWQGGTESAMFNRLEEIATRAQPQTPFLGGRLSRALEADGGDQEQRFLPTRINWVVQSGAVDFLHLMLVSMRWLMGSHARFCLSFHDELRYLVREELAPKAALAMHITNLLTRSFCVSRIGLQDLPMSVAFFSSVEVDTVLRKECSMDCQTPSNPHGLRIGYGIQPGESFSIAKAIEKAGGNDLNQWDWISKKSPIKT